MNRLVPVVAFGVAAVLAAPAHAHHSFAMFDAQKTLTFDGTVTEFQFTNPHSWLEIDVPTGTDANHAAGAKHWSLEMNNVLGLRRAGWRAGTLQRGDKVKVTLHPLRDGTSAGQLMTVVTADGKTLYGNGGPPGREGVH